MSEIEHRDATGIIRAIAWRPTDGGAMQQADECNVLAHRGLDLENRNHGKREVTLLAAEAWADVCRELGVDLSWHMRRANFLVAGVDLARTIGKTISIGEVEVYVHGESKPCQLMDDQHQGLRETLKPNGRGGVFGQVKTPGTVRIGDLVSFSNA
ncbi:MAG: MOSC domain-containing protein [Planctomycetes bacterium]|nr:MOSC domain-containing protein [Planctomycetota bacterium]